MTAMYTFATQAGPIPLSELDANFASIISESWSVVENIAALKALSVTGTGRAFVLDYWTLGGNGGGGPFWCDTTDTTSSDNYGTIIVANDGGRWKRIYTDQLSMRDFGVKADGTTDDYARAQSAITATVGVRLVWPSTPGTSMVIKTCLNVTGRGSSPTIWVGQGFNIDMSAGTVVKCQTAADTTTHVSHGWIADFTGSQNVSIEGINFWGTGTDASTKGFLFARTASCHYVQQIELRWMSIDVGTSPLINSDGTRNLGTIAIYNCQAEQLKTDHASFKADSAVVETLNNEVSMVSPWSLIDLTVGISTTNIQHYSSTFYAYTYAALTQYGVAGARTFGCVFARDGGSSFLYAIVLRASAAAYQNCQNSAFDGQVEGFTTGLVLATPGAEYAGIRTTLFMVAASGASPYVQCSTSQIMRNCVFDNQHTGNLGGHVALSLGAGCQLVDSYPVLYDSDTVSYAGCIPIGQTYSSGGSNSSTIAAIKNFTAGVDMAGGGSPDIPSSYADNFGWIRGAGFLKCNNVVGVLAGATIGTMDAAHRPNRTILGSACKSGGKATYFQLTSAGALSVGENLALNDYVDLSDMLFKQTQ